MPARVIESPGPGRRIGPGLKIRRKVWGPAASTRRPPEVAEPGPGPRGSGWPVVKYLQNYKIGNGIKESIYINGIDALHGFLFNSAGTSDHSFSASRVARCKFSDLDNFEVNLFRHVKNSEIP